MFHLGNGERKPAHIVESAGRRSKREDSGGTVALCQVYIILHALLASRCSLVIIALGLPDEVSRASSSESNIYRGVHESQNPPNANWRRCCSKPSVEITVGTRADEVGGSVPPATIHV